MRVILGPYCLDFDADDVLGLEEVPLPAGVVEGSAIAARVTLRTGARLLGLGSSERLPGGAVESRAALRAGDPTDRNLRSGHRHEGARRRLLRRARTEGAPRMILIVAPRNDAHALCVAQDLEKLGQPFRFVDSSRLTDEGRLQFRAGRHSGSTWTCIDGQPIDLETVDTVWHRRRFLPPVTARHSDRRSTVFPTRMDGDDLGRVRVAPRRLVRQRSGSPDSGGEAASAAARRTDRTADPRHADHERPCCGRGLHRSTRAARGAQSPRTAKTSLPRHEGMVGVRSRGARRPRARADDLSGDSHRLPRAANHRHRRSGLRRRVPSGDGTHRRTAGSRHTLPFARGSRRHTAPVYSRWSGGWGWSSARST